MKRSECQSQLQSKSASRHRIITLKSAILFILSVGTLPRFNLQDVLDGITIRTLLYMNFSRANLEHPSIDIRETEHMADDANKVPDSLCNRCLSS